MLTAILILNVITLLIAYLAADHAMKARAQAKLACDMLVILETQHITAMTGQLTDISRASKPA